MFLGCESGYSRCPGCAKVGEGDGCYRVLAAVDSSAGQRAVQQGQDLAGLFGVLDGRGAGGVVEGEFTAEQGQDLFTVHDDDAVVVLADVDGGAADRFDPVGADHGEGLVADDVALTVCQEQFRVSPSSPHRPHLLVSLFALIPRS